MFGLEVSASDDCYITQTSGKHGATLNPKHLTKGAQGQRSCGVRTSAKSIVGVPMLGGTVSNPVGEDATMVFMVVIPSAGHIWAIMGGR